MPRHDGSHGVYHSNRQKGGTSRRTRTPKNTYAAKQSTRPRVNLAGVLDALADVDLMPTSMPRQGGNTPRTGTTPQAPKPPKGGSKPVGTPRGR